jgi:hypothetical protein
MDDMQMEAMNKYVVWVSENEAERFDADLVISMLDEVQFFKSGKKVKAYKRKVFMRYNPNWIEQENTE